MEILAETYELANEGSNRTKRKQFVVGAAGQSTNLGIAQNVERLYGKVHDIETMTDKPMKTHSALISLLE